jgi:hypothetical protein
MKDVHEAMSGKSQTRNGIALLPVQPDAVSVTPETVKELQDAVEEPAAVQTDAQHRAALVARILEGRKGRPLPPGMTIEDVIAWGREGRA